MLFSAGSFFFFFNDTATTEIYTLSLHDALPISQLQHLNAGLGGEQVLREAPGGELVQRAFGIFSGERDESDRSEEHTSELQSLAYLVCRLLLEKKKRGLANVSRSVSMSRECNDY